MTCSGVVEKDLSFPFKKIDFNFVSYAMSYLRVMGTLWPGLPVKLLPALLARAG